MAEIPIPGDSSALASLAAQLGSAAGEVGAVRSRITADGLGGSWSGAAAEAFRASLSELPGELAKAAEALGEGNAAIARFSGELAELQERARWYEEQIDASRQEQAAAESRRGEAEAELDRARLRHSLATDPVSLQSAKAAVDLGEGLVSRAAASVEESAATVARLMSAAVSLREEYEAAVGACCAALDGVRGAGGHSLLGWIGDCVRDIGSFVERDAVALWHDGERVVGEVVDGALHELDEHWEVLRKWLSGASDVLGILSVAALLLPIPGADVAVFGLLAAASAGASGAVLLGDGIETARKEKRFEKFLPGDVFDFALSAMSMIGAPFRAAKEAAPVVDSRGPIEQAISDRIAGYKPVSQAVQDFRALPAESRRAISTLNADAKLALHLAVHDEIDSANEDGSLGRFFHSVLRGVMEPVPEAPRSFVVPVAPGLAI